MTSTRLPVARLAIGLVLCAALATTARAATTPARARPPAGTASAPRARARAAVGAPSGTTSSMSTEAPATRGSRSDSSYTLKAGQDGTVFKSLTVEGEDRVHVEFDRPALELELDPEQAPGLDWGTAGDVLDRTLPDLAAPLTAASAHRVSPYTGRPWLGRFATGAVARFRPVVKDVDRWKLVVANSKGETVTTFEGRGKPPEEIAWDGRSKSGAPVNPGITYSYVFEAFDRAGNKRNFVGQGFQVSAYRLDSPEGPVLVFSGRELPAPSLTQRGAGEAAILLESASWLNQSAKTSAPLRVTVTSRSSEQANALAARVVAGLTPHLIGDPARVQAVALVEADAPEDGTVRISTRK